MREALTVPSCPGHSHTKLYLNRVPVNPLEKLTPPTYDAYLDDLHGIKTVPVPMDQEEFLSFERAPSTMGSDGFAGSIGLLIGGPDGAIMAHYSNSTKSIQLAEENLPGLIKTNKKALADAKAFLFAEINPKTWAWETEENNQKLETIVNNLGIDPIRRAYIQPENLVDLNDYWGGCEERMIYGSMLLKYTGRKDDGEDKGKWAGFFIDSDLQEDYFEGFSFRVNPQAGPHFVV